MRDEVLDLFAPPAPEPVPPAYAPPDAAHVTRAGDDGVPRFDATGPLPRGVALLEASAGTGKTHGIASLVLRLVAEEGLGVDEILVVTFTEAATAELRDRVRRRLRDALALAERGARGEAVEDGAGDEVARHLVRAARADGELARLVARLRTALERFDDAPITTIHGFCHRVLRERAFECGGELDAELLTDDADLVEGVVRDFWARETAARTEAEVEALVRRGGLALAPLFALARRALRHADAACVPARDAFDAEAVPLAEACAERGALAEGIAARWAEDDTSEALALVEEARAAKRLHGGKWKADAVEARARAVAEWANGAPSTAALPEELRRFAASALADACNKGHAPPLHPLFDAVEALVRADERLALAAIAEAHRMGHDLVAWTRAECARRKRAARQLGFDDLLRLVRDALRRDAAGDSADAARDPATGDDGGIASAGGPLAAALRRSFRAALVDEFQDTDGVQWEIFRRAFGTPDHRLFLIGDPKQSIYAFRGADVDAYLAARADAATTWALDTNWRTDAPLVEALDAWWGAHPAPFAQPGIAWRRVRARHDGARLAEPKASNGHTAPLVVRFLAREGALAPQGKSTCITKETLRRVLPTLVASDVARFLASGATIADGPPDARGTPAPRPVRPRDVAVLVRSHAQAADVQRALRAAGIPAVIHGAASVLASREAVELAAVLAAVLEPASPSLARAALATDLLGLPAAAELAEARGERVPLGAGDVLAALAIEAEADAGADAARAGEADALLDRWAERLRAWRAAWRGDGAPSRRAAAPSVMRLVRALLDDLALPARLLALDDGERRLTNFLHLGELLHAEASARALAPGATLAWLREQIACGGGARDDAARQLRLESDDEAAQVVTVHSSKGLEYGAVWCPYLWDGRLSHADDFHAPCVPVAGAPTPRAIDLRAERASPAGAHVEAERFAEALRLAYVALTRARHRVTLWWGAVNDFGTSPLAWLLHGDAAAAGGDAVRDPAAARASIDRHVGSLDDGALRARLAALAAGARGLVRVVEEDASAPRVTWTPPAAPERPLGARAWTRTAPLDDGWRLGSFTGLARGAHATHDPHDDEEGPNAPEALGDALASDASDASADATPVGARPADDADVPLAAFPASAQAGLFFHEVLERHDPAQPDALRPLVEDRLAAYGFDVPRWCAPVTDELRRVLDAPLTPARDDARPLRLVDVGTGHRIAELRFELPACAADVADARAPQPITAAALADVFRAHPGGTLDGDALAAYADRVAALGFRPLHGFLTGAIDLVARHGGRWWLLDYKSNRLGPRRADYAPDRLRREMTEAHYVLQYHLYALALHRWLALRVPGYDWDRDVGGACWVFLRGVGEGTGVFVDRPPRARIEALDRLFRTGSA